MKTVKSSPTRLMLNIPISSPTCERPTLMWPFLCSKLMMLQTPYSQTGLHATKATQCRVEFSSSIPCSINPEETKDLQSWLIKWPRGTSTSSIWLISKNKVSPLKVRVPLYLITETGGSIALGHRDLQLKSLMSSCPSSMKSVSTATLTRTKLSHLKPKMHMATWSITLIAWCHSTANMPSSA